MASPSDGKSGNSKVNLLDLSAAAISSAIVAADQITALASINNGENDAGDENKKNARLKIDGSFVTDADMAAQQIIVDALYQKGSSEIRIVGEENEEEMRKRVITGHEQRLESIFQLARKEISIRYHGSSSSNPQHHFQYNCGDKLPLAQDETEENGRTGLAAATAAPDDESSSSSASVHGIDKMQEYEIDTDRVSVWIDPLDATNSYAKGDYDPVSILVAIVVDQIPCFGVICKPFGYSGQPLVLDTGCMAVYGGTLLGAAYIAGSRRIQNNGSNNQQDPVPRAVISKSRSPGIQDFVTHLAEKGIVDPQPLLVSGAGEKSLRIITRFENEGLWFFPKGGTSLWDVAASDALLRAIGGKLTDKYGNAMDYSKSRKEAENENGVVACYDQDMHSECIRLFSQGSWE